MRDVFYSSITLCVLKFHLNLLAVFKYPLLLSYYLTSIKFENSSDIYPKVSLTAIYQKKKKFKPR